MPTVYLTSNPSISASCPPLKPRQQEVSKAYFAKREEDAQYKTTVKNHTTKTGETLSKIAKKYNVKTKDVKRTKTTKYLQVGEIVKITTKEKTGVKVKFTKLDKATVGENVYIVVETLHLEEQIVLLNIIQGQEDVLAKKDELVTVQQNEQDVTLIKTKVGNYCEERDVINKDEFVNWAIVKVKLEPKAEEKQKKWTDGLECSGEKKALLYLLVDVHSENSIPNFKSQYVLYKGFKSGKDNSKIPNHFLNEDEAWFELNKKQEAPWMKFAMKEYNTYSNIQENTSPLKEKIEKYFDTTNAKTGKYTSPWCGAFVNWCFEQTKDYKGTNSGLTALAFDWGIEGNKKAKKSKHKPDGWKNGEECKAFYGAVIVLNYSHVAFIVGKNSKTNKYVYIGGNQGGSSSGTQKIQYGSVKMGNEFMIMKPKKYIVSKKEEQLKEYSIDKDGSYNTTR